MKYRKLLGIMLLSLTALVGCSNQDKEVQQEPTVSQSEVEETVTSDIQEGESTYTTTSEVKEITYSAGSILSDFNVSANQNYIITTYLDGDFSSGVLLPK